MQHGDSRRLKWTAENQSLGDLRVGAWQRGFRLSHLMADPPVHGSEKQTNDSHRHEVKRAYAKEWKQEQNQNRTEDKWHKRHRDYVAGVPNPTVTPAQDRDARGQFRRKPWWRFPNYFH